jgi:hypothetical protein
MNDQYQTVSQYVDCKSTLREKIIAIDNVISAMELKLLESVDSANYSEYQMDDGQMKIRTMYRSPKEVTNGILELEKLKQRYVNRYNGRVTRLVGGNL